MLPSYDLSPRSLVRYNPYPVQGTFPVTIQTRTSEITHKWLESFKSVKQVIFMFRLSGNCPAPLRSWLVERKVLSSQAISIGYLLAAFTICYPVAAQNSPQINLGPNINSQYSEVGPVVAPDGKTLFFHRNNHPENTYGATSSQDIWLSDLDPGGNWSPSRRLGLPLNDRKFNSLKGVTPDGNTILIEGAFVKGKYAGRGLSFSHQTDQGWGQLEKLNILGYTEMARGVFSSSSLSNDRKTLVLAFSEVHGSNFDDLYFSQQQDDGSWSKPRSLETLNTEYAETTPFLASDGATLYFSSNRPGGYGKNDIYYTKRLDETWQKWSAPVNLGETINSEGWEAYYSIDAQGEYAYLVSTKNSIGRSDIVKIKLKDELKPDPVVLISGTVYDAKSKLPIQALINYEVLPQGQNAGIARSNSQGHYKIVLPYGKQYGFLAEADHFASVSDNIDLTTVESYREINRDLYLVPLEIGETVRMNNIFFDFGKAMLRPGSFPELNRVSELMARNPGLVIRVAGHTDNVGTQERNLKLSEDRAAAVRQYLVESGVNSTRILIKGFGKSVPVVENSNDQNRQLNRRVEFRILEK